MDRAAIARALTSAWVSGPDAEISGLDIVRTARGRKEFWSAGASEEVILGLLHDALRRGEVWPIDPDGQPPEISLTAVHANGWIVLEFGAAMEIVHRLLNGHRGVRAALLSSSTAAAQPVRQPS